MKNRSEIWLRMLEDLGMRCSVSTIRDAETLTKRVAQEGDSFLTVTLPRMGKEFERALAIRSIPADLFRGFKRNALTVRYVTDDGDIVSQKSLPGQGTPRFLGGFLDLVFSNVLDVSWDDPSYTEDRLKLAAAPLLRTAGSGVFSQADAVHAVRQLCLLFGKEKELSSPESIQSEVASFTSTDGSLTDPLWTSGP